MFEAFYHMTRTPFTRDLPPEALYLSADLEEILGRLHYAAERQWFAVVTGDCGTGKSTAIRRLQAALDRTRYQLLCLLPFNLTDRVKPPRVTTWVAGRGKRLRSSGRTSTGTARR